MRLPPLCFGGFPALALPGPLLGGGFALGGEAGLEAEGLGRAGRLGRRRGWGEKVGKGLCFGGDYDK